MWEVARLSGSGFQSECEFGQVSEAGEYPGQAAGGYGLKWEVVRGHGHRRRWWGGRAEAFSSHSSGLNFLQMLRCKCNMSL